MERSLLMIVGIVFVVGFVGFLTVWHPTGAPLEGSISGRVITDGASIDACATCIGSPVCAAYDGTVQNYPNRCEAVCSGARVIYDGVCERIPRVRPE